MKSQLRNQQEGIGICKGSTCGRSDTGTNSDQSLWFWLRTNPVRAVIVSLLMLDWVPELIGREFGLAEGAITGTKIAIIPMAFAIVIAIVRRSGGHATKSTAWFGVLAVVTGTGLGTLLGNVEIARFQGLLVASLVVVYFQQMRTLSDCRAVLSLCVYLTLGTGIGQYLGEIGYVRPARDIVIGNMERIFIAGNTSTVGFIPLMAAASLGGILLQAGRRRWAISSIVVAFVTIVAGAYSVLVAAQRSSATAFLLCLLLSIGFYVTLVKGRSLIVIVMFILMGGGLYITNASKIKEVAAVIMYRTFESEGPGGVLESTDLRWAGIRQFGVDLVTGNGILAQGSEFLWDRTGIVAHNILAEAYYDGGVVLFLALVAALVLLARNVVGIFIRGETASDRALAASMLFLCIGSGIHFMAQTGLQLRPMAMLLGLGLSSAWRTTACGRKHTDRVLKSAGV